MITGQSGAGAFTSAASALGTVIFDGAGNFNFSGQSMSSQSGLNQNLQVTGTYQLNPNGLFVMQSLLTNTFTEWGGVSGTGPSAFVASTTEPDGAGNSVVDILVGVPLPAGATNGSFNGAFQAGLLDFPNANSGAAREAAFNITADGGGNIASISVSGKGLDLGGAAITQTIPSATYSLTPSGTGSLLLGAASSSQLVSGAKTFALSADGSILLGGSPSGYDMLIGLKALSGAATNASATGSYFIGAMDLVASTGSPVDAYSGGANFTGSGAALFHNRLKSFTYPAYDYTFASQFSVASNGTFSPSNTSYQYTLGVGGQAFIALGSGSQYSLGVGFAAAKSSGAGVFLNPLGIVNAANFSPIPNPVGPGEVVTMFGSGLANGTVSATTLPLPTSLGGVTVTVNGTPAPLFYVSATQISALVPSTVGPAHNVFNATFQVNNNGNKSNSVTVYANDTAPGVISLSSNGIGAAAAEHSNYNVVTSSLPAHPGEVVTVYLVGLGAVTPPISDGSPASSTPPLSVTAEAVNVTLNGTSGALQFAGPTPGTVGLYQVNVQIPPSASPGNLALGIATPEGFTTQTTINVAAGTASARSSQN